MQQMTNYSKKPENEKKTRKFKKCPHYLERRSYTFICMPKAIKHIKLAILKIAPKTWNLLRSAYKKRFLKT